MDKNKLKLTFLLLFAALPIGLSSWYFHQHAQEGAVGTTNKGVLVVPVVELPSLQLVDGTGAAAYLPFEELVEGVSPEEYDPRPWQLLFLGGVACDEACLERLYFLRQIHTRLGKESDRVERAYVISAGMNAALESESASQFTEQFPDMKILHSNKALLESLLLPSAQGRNPVEEHLIYLADPVGNIMLYFTPENTPDEILRDIDKLLDQSSLG